MGLRHLHTSASHLLEVLASHLAINSVFRNMLDEIEQGQARLATRTSGPGLRKPNVALHVEGKALLRQESSHKSRDEGTSTIHTHVFNLIKTIVGAGALGLPSGIAAMGSTNAAVFPALLIMVVIALLSAFSFSTVGYVCNRTNASTYRQAWERSVGESTAWIPALCCMSFTGCVVLSYSMVLADTISFLMDIAVGFTLSREQILVGLTALVLLPLCLMKDLKSLTPFSILGTLAMLYTALAMSYRYFIRFDQDETDTRALPLSQTTFVLATWKAMSSTNTTLFVSMLSTAFMGHFNAPQFFWELQNNTMARFNVVSMWGFLGSFALSAIIAVAGFLTFGATSNGLILNNYDTNDRVMIIARMAVTLSIIGSYPLTFVGFRNGVLDLAQISDTRRRHRLFVPLTVGLLAMVTAISAVVTDLAFVFALNGATWGTSIIYLFPCIMLAKLSAKHDDLNPRIMAATLVTGGIGIFLTVVGTTRALRTA